MNNNHCHRVTAHLQLNTFLLYLKTVDTKNTVCINKLFRVLILMYENVHIRSRNILNQLKIYPIKQKIYK